MKRRERTVYAIVHLQSLRIVATAKTLDECAEKMQPGTVWGKGRTTTEAIRDAQQTALRLRQHKPP